MITTGDSKTISPEARVQICPPSSNPQHRSLQNSSSSSKSLSRRSITTKWQRTKKVLTLLKTNTITKVILHTLTVMKNKRTLAKVTVREMDLLSL
jgi:hypothetical protein